MRGMTEREIPAFAKDFELRKKGPTQAFVRRLVDGALRPSEKAEFARVQQLMRLEEDALLQKDIAPQLGMTPVQLRNWQKTDRYRLMRKMIEEQVHAPDDEEKSAAQRASERRRYDAHAKDANDYFDVAFRRHAVSDPKKGIKAGDFVDLDRAERAANKLAASQGWTEPLPAYVKPRELPAGVVQSTMAAIAATDRRELVVRVTKTTETTEIAARAEREEALV